MLHIAEEDLETMLQAAYQRGISQGIKQMEKRLLHACKEGNPLDIRGRAFFVKSDMEPLKMGVLEEYGVKCNILL